VIAGFIVDFYCASAQLAIEVDGSSHSGRQDYDSERDRALANLGIRTLRVPNESVANDLAEVLRKIEELTSPLAPLPSGEGKR
jgi:very-short-patch-repair endonuclease